MLYATKEIHASGDYEKISPRPGMRALCPSCGGDVLAKCGSIKAWHWSHVAADCDPWSEPETEWHLNWKRRFPPECREVVIGNHRADVRTKNGIVIEFQHSSISVEEIRDREAFYGERMMWVIDGAKFRKNCPIFWSSWQDRTHKATVEYVPSYSIVSTMYGTYRKANNDGPFIPRVTYKEVYDDSVGPFRRVDLVDYNDDFWLDWKHRRKCWWQSKRPKFICFGGVMVYIKKMYSWEPYNSKWQEDIFAKKISRTRFLEKYAQAA